MYAFLIFFAPFIIVVLALFAAFYVAPKDQKVNKQ